MKYALISDVHSNLPALEAVLEDVDAIYHLGEPPDEFADQLRVRGTPKTAEVPG
jgi:hypothetical protein